VKDTPPLHGSLEINNRYSAFTTPLRINGSFSYDNLWQLGHTVGASFQLSPEAVSEVKVFSGFYLARVPGVDWLSLEVEGTDQDSNVSTLGGIGVAGKGQVLGLRAIIDLPQPTIAAVTGYGVGGGCGLALACDLRVGDATTQMGIPAARLSIVYDTLDCSLLLRAVGLANAKLVLYSGRYFPLADCRAMGLIEVVSEDGALSGARALAQELAARAPLSQRGAKVVLEALARGEAGQRAAEIAAVQDAAVNSEDYRAARQAFMEKRQPVFTGR